jgi:shikimate dehydrogenase
MAQDNDTKSTYGLLGRNISYSLSPVMHNAAFRHFGVPAEYKLFDIEEDDLNDFFRKNVLGGYLGGFNITVPYKIKMLEVIQNCALVRAEKDRSVELVGAINTVKVNGKRLGVYNTDIDGFFDSLIEDLGFEPGRWKNYFVFGAGGAGRAICLFLASLKYSEKVKVHDVDEKKLGDLMKGYKASPSADKISPVRADDLQKEIRHCDLIINATPVGTKEDDPPLFALEYLGKGMAVYDLVYARETDLVKEARAKGLKASGGLGMLIGQGARAFNIWTGKPLEETRKVMREALKTKGYGTG